MAVSIEDLVNQALVELGQKRLVHDIFEGSTASNAALEVYAQSRDELLGMKEWAFARRTKSLTLLKGPPPPGGYSPIAPWTTAYPKPGWLYEYTYPADCIEFAAIVAPPAVMFDINPQPAVWRIDNDDAYSPARKVILANVKNALGVYTGKIVDISTWEEGFVSTLVKALKAKLALALGRNLETERVSMAEAAQQLGVDTGRG